MYKYVCIAYNPSHHVTLLSLRDSIKPDIIAPGHFIASAKATSEDNETVTCDLTYKAGTSMAAPIVAGTTGLQDRTG